MNNRHHAIEATIIAIGCGATGSAIGLMIRLGISSESIFSLLGALIGAAASVGGAVWVVSWQQGAKRRIDRKLLIAAIDEPLQTLKDLASGHKKPLAHLWLAVDRIKDIRLVVTIDSVQLLKAFEEIEMITPEMRESLRKEVVLRDMYGHAPSPALEAIMTQLNRAKIHVEQT